MTVEATEYRLEVDANVRGMFSNRRGDAISTSVTVLAHDVRVEVWERTDVAGEFNRTGDLRFSAANARALAMRLIVLADAAERQAAQS
jgi:hypothetical protein